MTDWERVIILCAVIVVACLVGALLDVGRQAVEWLVERRSSGALPRRPGDPVTRRPALSLDQAERNRVLFDRALGRLARDIAAQHDRDEQDEREQEDAIRALGIRVADETEHRGSQR